VRWHRAGFRRYWRWKSRNLGGRPPIDGGLRALTRRMSLENGLWGAPRIHGELLKLGFAVAQSTVAKYMASPDVRRFSRRVNSSAGCPVSAEGRLSATICRRSRPWTCSWFRPGHCPACCARVPSGYATAAPLA
jgi:hypothetical protein